MFHQLVNLQNPHILIRNELYSFLYHLTLAFLFFSISSRYGTRPPVAAPAFGFGRLHAGVGGGGSDPASIGVDAGVASDAPRGRRRGRGRRRPSPRPLQGLIKAIVFVVVVVVVVSRSKKNCRKAVWLFLLYKKISIRNSCPFSFRLNLSFIHSLHLSICFAFFCLIVHYELHSFTRWAPASKQFFLHPRLIETSLGFCFQIRIYT